MDGSHSLRQAALVSRVSFEPLSVLDQQNGLPLTRDGSGVSAQSDSEFETWREEHPCALHSFDQIAALAAGKLVAVFLDYDGTLTPIVSNPDMALMSEHARAAVRRVAQLFPTAIISGRGREKVQQFVQLAELYYAGSHGMDIVGPDVEGTPHADLAFQPAAQYEPLMDAVYEELAAGVAGIAGSSVEHNKFCVSVHFRNCAPDDYPAVVDVVDAVAAAHPELRITRGRKVLEVRPQVDWDKGTALAHLLELLGLADPQQVFCLYIGDDRTDEDAFKVLAERQLGGGILVSTKPKPTAGLWTLRDPTEVAAFLNRLVAWGQTDANRWHTVGSCTGWAVCPSVRRRSADRPPAAPAAVPCAAPAGCNGTGAGGSDGGNGMPGSTSASAAAAFAKGGLLGQTPVGLQPGGQPLQTAAGALQRPRPPLPPRPAQVVAPVAAAAAAAEQQAQPPGPPQ